MGTIDHLLAIEATRTKLYAAMDTPEGNLERVCES